MSTDTTDKVPHPITLPITFPLQPVFPYSPEKTSIIALPKVILLHPAIPLQQQPCRPPLHERETPPRRIGRNPIPFEQSEKIAYAQVARTAAIELLKHFIEEWQSEVPVGIVGAGIGAVLGSVNAVYMDVEKRVG